MPTILPVFLSKMYIWFFFSKLCDNGPRTHYIWGILDITHLYITFVDPVTDISLIEKCQGKAVKILAFRVCLNFDVSKNQIWFFFSEIGVNGAPSSCWIIHDVYGIPLYIYDGPWNWWSTDLQSTMGWSSCPMGKRGYLFQLTRDTRSPDRFWSLLERCFAWSTNVAC